ncbi:MAG: hypothetical protein KDA69_08860 [Planctomycetaceae bacterium]|nr:hypothetical protein [Planctomycetaceae bacterium]
MTYNVNGIGTDLVTVSGHQNVNGQYQYDAMESVVFIGMPLIPYKVVHVVSSQPHGTGMRYQSHPLRWSFRLFFKGMANGWGNMLLLLGGAFTVLFGFIIFTNDKPFSEMDAVLLTVCGSVFAVGLLSKGLWYMLDRRDMRIREILGPHQLGSSDPMDWPDDVADSMADAILKQFGGRSLTELAERSISEDNDELAMMCVRLAQRDSSEAHAASPLFDELMRTA